MKKILLFILVIVVFLFAGFKGAEIFLNSKIEAKKEIVYNNWEKLYLKNRDVNLVVKQLNSNQIYLNNDSLNNILTHHEKSKECSLDYVESEYYINKGINKIMNDSLINEESKNKMSQNIIELNSLVSNYNIAVKDYNTFIRGFPINLYAYKKYTTKVYFDLEYGAVNKNPKVKYDETLDWMLEMEKDKGYE